MTFLRFLGGAAGLVVRGNRLYYAWCALLLVLVFVGAGAYATQLRDGLVVTKMRDSVTWAFYIGNFTFLVGVAAAAVMLVIPAYLYDWGPIKEIVILGELLAISACIMCLIFVTVDMGRPDRFWHLMPIVGKLNFPGALLSWDVVVLNAYLLLNLTIVTYMVYSAFMGREPNHHFTWPLVIFSIPFAISIHTVTAFIYNGMVARPYWNASILAPKFLASAFCSGPAVLLIVLQILRKMTRLKIQDAAIWKIAELMAYAMGINLFFTGAEIFKDFYSHAHHAIHTQYFYFGIGAHRAIVPYAWMSLFFGVVAFLLFMIPATRKNVVTLNAGCILIYASCYIEKGIGLLIPGMTPDGLGEIYEYTPSTTEVLVAAGTFSLGFLIYTILLKVVVPVMLGEFRVTDLGDKAVVGTGPEAPPAGLARAGH
ncbi:MAG: polysulfide reductase NrfD [Planctomycetia bacterium]|nr:polysulfide reductase NrfD [Planctomycetia bacterium]